MQTLPAPAPSLTESIRRRLHTYGPGSVLSPADFLPLGSRAAVDQALARLTKAGVLQRLRRGVYYYPKTNAKLGLPLSPAPDAIAQALARGQKLQLQVAGAQAAPLLGLSEQVPARVVYLTDGTTGKVQVGTQTVELRHAAPRAMQTAGRISGTLIQALRHLGKQNVTPEVIQRLRDRLSEEDKKIVAQDLFHAPGWIRPVLAAVTHGIGLEEIGLEEIGLEEVGLEE